MVGEHSAKHIIHLLDLYLAPGWAEERNPIPWTGFLSCILELSTVPTLSTASQTATSNWTSQPEPKLFICGKFRLVSDDYDIDFCKISRSYWKVRTKQKQCLSTHGIVWPLAKTLLCKDPADYTEPSCTCMSLWPWRMALV